MHSQHFRQRRSRHRIGQILAHSDAATWEQVMQKMMEAGKQVILTGEDLGIAAGFPLDFAAAPVYNILQKPDTQNVSAQLHTPQAYAAETDI